MDPGTGRSAATDRRLEDLALHLPHFGARVDYLRGDERMQQVPEHSLALAPCRSTAVMRSE